MDRHAQTARADSLSQTSETPMAGLDFGKLPPIAILKTRLNQDEEKSLKETLRLYNASLTTDMSRAKILLGKVGTKGRAAFELRSRHLIAEEFVTPKRRASPVKIGTPNKKQRVLESPFVTISASQEDYAAKKGSEETSDTADEAPIQDSSFPRSPTLHAEDEMPFPTIVDNGSDIDIVWVVNLNWIEACTTAGHLVPLGGNLMYQGKVQQRPKPSSTKSIKDIFSSQNILDRAKLDAPTMTSKTTHKSPQFGNQQTTSEYEGEDSDIPPPPEWVKKGVKYACQRFTPANGPNEDFLDQLKKIRTNRILIEDEIGVRAYSTIIAAIAAYPYKLSHPREIAQLPGCDEKTAVLFVEWKNTGKIKEVEDCENDEAMKVLRSFYDIWGVGAKTARHFYYDNHWTELDDIIEHGWNDLDRVQQIGIKYYEEFQEPIPRAEVEHIAAVVRDHAVKLRDEHISITIVGGYRRGKSVSGDVDIIVSHPELESTAGLVQEIVESLEDAQWITHTLTMSLANTKRGQHTLPFRSAKGAGVGFDTLDKALVVWQDPAWPTREGDLERNPRAKNPAIHRRVDIIVAPWRTVGCAVMGWSGGTTFQRDLRRYAKHVKGWKFDSSGIRSRANGEAIMIEGPDGVEGTPEDAEKAVFKGLGLEYIPPEYRVTY
ncbi:hypothetical protein COCC4DRAFT_61420 [Bipolaris maydis ATCC 48331]|uniref:DNA polymerase n=2 Tax=Cochliobolus heterostrophus TaxID=5016 RepID=M2T5F8_COCH5|nr:uncharacterized protein COCC4DRAFT_61420 [Bipolaris maydis ATCC 48331]EMD92805.1 hypothetical protein COCHEDRAFT_1193188 [Bipolaris maydis C5]KAJ5026107.1 hypothetical protein J3E73DRAFT_212758 [Bipolaris maydis]ENI04806.1 hypothetical protein COCC4DRAFT_61420 [Bipolaris maydis ATCC 48331]KAJ6208335.1 hypothetical protein PSV09DRAFT_1193188 [Bipolaris maydis]KAJ6270320.1 hypothetical protein PSV08DRAFT_203904 [Bipolaris maydis]